MKERNREDSWLGRKIRFIVGPTCDGIPPTQNLIQWVGEDPSFSLIATLSVFCQDVCHKVFPRDPAL